MQRIREWMEANPDQAKDVRRQNKSYVFFRITNLATEDEAVGGEGVPLVPGRSIAVDHALHVYGTPFFIDGRSADRQRQGGDQIPPADVAQDTGSAIVGPARADIYFGAGDEAARIAGRIKNPGDFVMLLPRDLDPVEAGRDMPLPPERPSDVQQSQRQRPWTIRRRAEDVPLPEAKPAADACAEAGALRSTPQSRNLGENHEPPPAIE